jgi:RNA polymerase sigma-70 factor (ECF subfamily)
LDDEQLEIAQAFAAGEAWAYDAAYRAHGRVLYAAAFAVSRDAQEAEDCVHDVLVRLWRRDGFRVERGSLRAFLAVSVRNEALSRMRKRGNRERIERSIETPSDEPDIGAGVAEREAVHSAMAALTEKQRRCIELAYYRRLTHEQIAGELGEPVGTIKSRLSSALRALRANLFGEESAHVGS